MRAKTFRDIDNAATAPIHGFRDADDYYARSSSIHFLGAITTPTLCLSAADDPFLPAEVLETSEGGGVAVGRVSHHRNAADTPASSPARRRGGASTGPRSWSSDGWPEHAR